MEGRRNTPRGKIVLISALVLAGGYGIWHASQSSSDQADAAKVVRWTETAPISTMDPSKVTTAVDFDAITAIGDGLYRGDPDNKPQLALAESMQKSKDGKTYTFKLHPNLQWADGSALTADDFVYGWRRTVDPKTAASYAELFEKVKNGAAITAGKEKNIDALGVEAVDQRTLKVTLDEPVPYFEELLSMPPFFPQKQAFVEKAGKRYGSESKYTLASGPFILKGWNGSNDRYDFVKNQKYYDKDAVQSDHVEVRSIVDQNTGYNLYLSNTIDFTTLTPQQVTASQHREDYTTVPSATTAYLQLNQAKVKAFREQDVRRALSYAIDRTILTDKILTGSAQPAKTFTPTKVAEDPNTKKDFAETAAVKDAIAYDLDYAQKLFKQGMRKVGQNKLTLELLTDDSDAAKRSAQYLQAQLEKLDGLTIKIKSVPSQQRMTLTEDKDFEVVISLWGGDYADPSTFLDLYMTGGTFNYGGWSNADYDAAMKRASTTHATEPKARFKDLREAEQILEKDMGLIPLYYRSTAALQRKNVEDMMTHPAGTVYDWKTVKKSHVKGGNQ